MSTEEDVEEKSHSRRSSDDDRSERKKKKKSSRDDESVRSSRSSHHKKKKKKDDESSLRESGSTGDKKKKKRSSKDGSSTKGHETADEILQRLEARQGTVSTLDSQDDSAVAHQESSSSSKEKKKKRRSSNDESSSHRSKKKDKDESSSRGSKSRDKDDAASHRSKKKSSKDRHRPSSRESSASSGVGEEEDVKVGAVAAVESFNESTLSQPPQPRRKSSASDKMFTVRKGSKGGGKRWDQYTNDDSAESSKQFSVSSISSGFSMPASSSRALEASKGDAARVGAVAVNAGEVPDRIQNMLDRKFNEFDDPNNKEQDKAEQEGAAAPSSPKVGAHRETSVPSRIQHMLDEKFRDFGGQSKQGLSASSNESTSVLSPVQSKIQTFQPEYAENSPKTAIDKLQDSATGGIMEPAQAQQNIAPAAATQFSMWNAGNVEKTSVIAPDPDQMANRLMADQEMALSSAEKTEQRLAQGLCPDCGRTQTHEKIKYGPFQTFRKMEPLTTPGRVYKGYCLYCNNLHDLRRYLHEPYLREQDMDGSLDTPITAGTTGDESAGGGLAGITHDSSEDDFTRKKRRIQICLCIAVLAVIAGGIGLAVTLVGKTNGTPTVAAPPTPAPGPLAWRQVGSDITESFESFGYKVSVSEDGSRVAVSAPEAKSSTGRVDVYEYQMDEWQRLGEPVLGDFQGDMAGYGMDLSFEGDHLIVGYPANENMGMAKVFIHSGGAWRQMGSTLRGDTTGGWFGASVAISATSGGVFAAVGAPLDTNEEGSEAGRVRVFELVDSDWVQFGSDLIGRAALDRFGTSVDLSDDGHFLAVGAPNNDDRWQDGGQVHIYEYKEEKTDWMESLKSLKILGDEEGHQFGSSMSLSGFGDTVVSSSLVATNDEGTPGGGDPRVVYIAYIDGVGEELGYGFPEIPGTLGLGQSVDIDYDGTKVILSTLNLDKTTGKAMVYDIAGKANWYIYSDEYGGEQLGPDEWLGLGPSVAIGDNGDYFAIGYESIVVDEQASPVVRVYHYGQGPPVD